MQRLTLFCVLVTLLVACAEAPSSPAPLAYGTVVASRDPFTGKYDTTIPPTVVADPDDDAVLACALAAQAEAIVSGDSDLLSLKSFQGIPILTAAELLGRVVPPSALP